MRRVADEERKGTTLLEVTRLGKDRKALRIWLMQPDAWKNNKEMEEDEQEEVVLEEEEDDDE